MNCSIKGNGNLVEIPNSLRENRLLTIDVSGTNNRLTVAEGCRINACRISIRGDDASVSIGANCLINGEIAIRSSDAHVSIGCGTTIMRIQLSVHEPGNIRIGEDCMFSGGISMDVSDMHSIIELSSGRRINPPKDITIGNHVWIGRGVTILKGVEVGHDSIIGAQALVCKAIPPYSLSVGIPAKVIREGVTWDRRRLPFEGIDGRSGA